MGSTSEYKAMLPCPNVQPPAQPDITQVTFETTNVTSKINGAASND